MDRARFYTELRSSGLFGTSLSQGQVDTLEMILDEGQARSIPLPQLAYVLATTYHEVGSALQPKSENLNYSARRIRQVWPSRFGNIGAARPYANNPRKLANKVYADRLGNGPEASGDGWTYRGRGFCQITGKANYASFARLLRVDIVADPDLAMEPRLAALILFDGMLRGLFTGKRLADYFGRNYDLIGARSIINADAASNGQKVAGHARSFERALAVAGYGQAAPAAEDRGVLAARQVALNPAEQAFAGPSSRPQSEPGPAERYEAPATRTWLGRLIALFIG